MSMGKAAVFTGVGKPLELRTYETKEPAPGHARVHMTYSGICGTDVHIFKGRIGLPAPCIPGHEMVGRIDAISPADSAASGLSVGDPVIVNVALPCGSCALCTSGDEADCVNMGVTYVHDPADEPHFFGGYADYNDSPVGNLIPIPDRVMLKSAAVFACAGPTVFQAISLAERGGVDFAAVKTAVVQGFGPVGAFAVLLLKSMGIKNIFCVTQHAKQERDNMALRCGANAVLCLETLGEDGVKQAVLEATGGLGADLALEASGNPQAFVLGLDLLRNRGVYLIPGQYSNAGAVSVEPQRITLKALHIFGSAQYNRRDVERYLAFLRGRPDLQLTVERLAKEYPLEKVNEALDEFGSGVKILLRGEPSYLTKEDLKEGFRKLGVKAGMKLMVHSSLSRFGRVEGGAATVVDALMELLTPEGTLVMPSFNHEAPYFEGKIYDVRETPTINGAIPDSFWRRPGVYRSINPTHAFAAWGKDAARYTEDHQKTSAMGPDSPLGRLMEDGGWCLLLGIGYGNNTFHHYVETCEGAPCLRLRGERFPVRLADGTETMAHTWSWRGGYCPIDDRASYAPYMASIDRHLRVGDAEVTMYKLSEGYEVIAHFLREGLDDMPPCSRCSRRPRVCQWTVEDEE